MIGRLLHSAASSLNPNASRAQTSLESVTEETHTHELLYPDRGALHQTQHHAYPFHYSNSPAAALAATSFDDRGGLDIQSPRHVRIIIAQDGNIRSHQPQILYDSQPPPSSLVRQTISPERSKGEARLRDTPPLISSNQSLTLTK